MKRTSDLFLKSLLEKLKGCSLKIQPIDFHEAEDIAQQALINIARTRAETRIEYLTSYLFTTEKPVQKFNEEKN